MEEKRDITKHQEEVYRCVHHDFDGHTVDEAANILNITPDAIYKTLARLKDSHPELFPILSRDNAKAWGLWFVSGLSCDQIAEQMGVTSEVIRWRLKRVKESMGYKDVKIAKVYDAISLDTLDLDRTDIKHKF